ncbi:MAG: DUF721 domain-containing protein [Candidatus Kapabacteria bacterium]|jgi:predicted nucleic acid-binding Zn ribbon protein|nr:DUF721 domain-containing protein [Candidatus Kapabacteria bacterium]
MAQSLSDLVGDVITKYHLQAVLDEERVPDTWREVIGPALAARTQVRGFYAGMLRIHVPDAVWRLELTARREELRVSINARLGREVVREITFR